MCTQLGLLNMSWQSRMGVSAKTGWRAAFRLARAMERDEADPVIIASLRFYIVQQRVHGLAAKRIPRLRGDEEDVAVFMQYSAVMFVLAHEAAHFALGHLVNGGLSELSGQSAELEADAFALDIVQAALSAEIGPKVQAEGPALTGALVALLATHVAETALFLRKVHSHPPADTRIIALARTRPRTAQGVFGFMSGLMRSVDLASQIFGEVPTHWWEELRSQVHPQYLVDGDGDPFKQSAFLDRWCGHKPSYYLQYLEDREPLLAPIFRQFIAQLAQNDTAGALATLGLSPRKIERLVAPDNGLTFNFLMQQVAAAPALSSIHEDRRITFPLALTYCLEQSIRGINSA
jgi:hypothetical protein